MSRLALIMSGCFEAVWAVALGRSEGFTRLGPSIVFLLALAASTAGLVLALREIRVGTGYAVWVGIGAALMVGYGMATGAEPAAAHPAARHPDRRGDRRQTHPLPSPSASFVPGRVRSGARDVRAR